MSLSVCKLLKFSSSSLPFSPLVQVSSCLICFTQRFKQIFCSQLIKDFSLLSQVLQDLHLAFKFWVVLLKKPSKVTEGAEVYVHQIVSFGTTQTQNSIKFPLKNQFCVTANGYCFSMLFQNGKRVTKSPT